MSYSRWSNSSWYTFWNVSGGNTRETQLFSAWYSLDGCVDWTFEEVARLFTHSPDTIINLLENKYGCSGDEANELQEYMQQWRSDVNQKFSALL